MQTAYPALLAVHAGSGRRGRRGPGVGGWLRARRDRPGHDIDQLLGPLAEGPDQLVVAAPADLIGQGWLGQLQHDAVGDRGQQAQGQALVLGHGPPPDVGIRVSVTRRVRRRHNGGGLPARQPASRTWRTLTARSLNENGLARNWPRRRVPWGVPASSP